MDPFEALKKIALERRNKAHKAASAEYHLAIEQIDQLRALLGCEPVRRSRDFFAWYNFSRKNEALGGNTPAMAAGIADKVWTIRELLERAAEA